MPRGISVTTDPASVSLTAAVERFSLISAWGAFPNEFDELLDVTGGDIFSEAHYAK